MSRMFLSKNMSDGKMVATIKGVDVYDPTIREKISFQSTDDIACGL